ncbi:MAG TPA: protein kinase [Thermoanaerobacterales bacterium]|nr:protein kinase [Thermoanaerobacterales bacterium]
MTVPKLTAGYEVTGRWNKKKYAVISQLGKGGTARVYLALDKVSGNNVALKISENFSSLNREYNIMRLLSANKFSPQVYEIDDCKIMGKFYNYIAMEYIQGTTLKMLINQPIEPKTALSIIKFIAIALGILHKNGYIYCDLKPENIIYDKRKSRIVLIDFGGAVKKGSCVVEYTPVFDRSSWGIGTRRADESYDIFALSMLLMILLKGELYNPSKQEFYKIIKESDVLKMEPIKKGLLMKYSNIWEFYRDIKSMKNTGLNKEYDKILNSILVIAISIFLGIIIAAYKIIGF